MLYRSLTVILATGSILAAAAVHADEHGASSHADETHIKMQPKSRETIKVEDHLKKTETSAGVEAKASKQAAHHEKDHDSVPAEKSLGWLKNGNTRYLNNTKRNDGKAASDRKRLTSGQHPHAIVLSCSDSRVPPEIVFDQALGEIFVIRVAGESLDHAVVASIEYAVEHLGPKLIVVMGHTQCGAVKAALAMKDGERGPSADLDHLLSDIKPHFRTLKDPPSENLEVESAVNADGVARDLVRRSEIVRKRVESGELVIKTALYRMDSGKVNFY